MSAPLSQHGPAGEPPPGVNGGGGGFDKSGLLRDYVRRFQVRTLVETGLYQGMGSGMDVGTDTYCAVDWQAENIAAARRRRPDGVYFCGDSADGIPWLLGREFPLPALFWLDAHALDEDEGSPSVCPLLSELAAIGAWKHARSCVVLIDDLWGMGSLRGWPTLDELRFLADSAGVWNRDEYDGVMRLVPRLELPAS